MINRTSPNQLFAMQMLAIRKSLATTERFLAEDRADRELANFSRQVIRSELETARKNGKQGWWNEKECSTEHLQNLLDAAYNRNDLTAVITYASMLHARSIADSQTK